MSRKNLLLGIGIGLVCSGAILMSFQGNSGSELSDEEIKQRAAKLGMVEENQEPILTSELENTKEDAEETQEESGSETTESETTAGGTTESKTKESETGESENKQEAAVVQQTKKTVTVTENTGEEETETTQEKASKKKKQEKKTASKKKSKNTITVKIKQGMSAEAICQEMENKGLIEDADDFKDYLIEKNIQYKLRAGNYKIAAAADYDAIIEEIYKG